MTAKTISLSLLQIAVVLIAIAALVFLLVEPHFEGRNANATFFAVYFKDPFLACAYAASTLFFVALYKAFRLLQYVRQGELHSPHALKALRVIRNCAATLALLLLGAVAYLVLAWAGKDDIAGGVAVGLFLAGNFFIIGALATRFEIHIRKNISPGRNV